ncbi:MAG TPA: penicillin acylase family protein [Acidimicrobiia bacterium]|jgi:penicillin amidase|nr:penicillin acylase family protein [Acidimicrobiia bacterium]
MTDAADPSEERTSREPVAADPPTRARWRRIGGATLKWGGLALVVAMLGGALFMLWSTRRPFPQVDGELTVVGLRDEVEVIRDSEGVPHIYAANAEDLMMAQGFVHAQDRFFQMDSWRHIGAGRLAEMFGEDQLDTDSFIRAMGWYELAATQFDASSPTAQAYLLAYAAGVNAYIADRSPAELGFEYTILELINHDYDPEPWTPIDTLVWGKVMSWDLRGNVDAEIDRALLLGVMSEDEVHALYPAYPDEAPLIVAHDGPRQGGPGMNPPPVTGLTIALERVRDNTELVDAMTGGGGDGLGSNSWVVSGDHTATGAPILANDPHLGIRMPSIWYQVGLHCTVRTADCPFDVTGFSFAGVPGVIIGHNDRIAWGFTNLGPDVMDLYVEKVNPNDPNQYEVNGEWVDMEVQTEIVEIAGGEPVEVTVRTTRHGPVVSDVFGRLDDFDTAGIELPEPYVVTLRWTALEDLPALTDTVFGLNTAQNWDEFRAALATFSVPAQNVIYADVDGNIGYQAPGIVPIRNDGDGRVPVPGWTDRYEWTGFIDYDDLPRVLNPEDGWIVTANNAVLDGTYPELLTTDWNLGDRATRIVELVSALDDATIDDMAAIQFDNLNLAAERIRPLFLAIDPSALSEMEAEAQALLGTWNLDNDAASPGAAVFEAAWAQLLDRMFTDDLPEDIEAHGGARWSLAIEALAADANGPFWDDQATPETETRDDIVTAAFRAGVADVADLLGDDPADWAWGEMHTATFENETLGQSGIGLIENRFNRGPYPTSGGFDIVNATGWTPSEGFIVDWVPSFRMVVDMADLDRSLWVNTTGASGHPYSAHYQDQIEAWQTGEYFPMRWGKATIQLAAEATLRLVPLTS